MILKISRCFLLVLLLLMVSAIAFAKPQKQKKKHSYKASHSKKKVENKNKQITGLASFYSDKFVGKKTANGEIFSQKKMTAACNLLPLGTKIKVTNIKNGKSVIVRTNDRLHPKTKRIIDLSKAAAEKLGILKLGLAKVTIEIVGKDKHD